MADLGSHDLLVTLLAKVFTLNVTPSITLTAPAVAGSSILQVSHADALKVVKGMPLLWFDGGPPGGDHEIGNEPGPIAVASADPVANTITLNYNGQPYGLTGLHSTHETNARASLNLFPDAPNDTGPGIAGDAPFVWVWVITERINITVQMRTVSTQMSGSPSRQNRRVAMIVYESQIEQPEPDTDADFMDTNVYAYIKQEAARAAIDASLKSLSGDPYLNLNGVPHIAGVGDDGQGVAVVDWAKFARDKGQTPVLQATMQLVTKSQI